MGCGRNSSLCIVLYKNILLFTRIKELFLKDYSQTISVINKYRITDTNLFEIILKKNQGLSL